MSHPSGPNPRSSATPLAQAQRSLHPAHGAPTPLAKSGMSAAPLAEYIYLQYKVTI